MNAVTLPRDRLAARLADDLDGAFPALVAQTQDALFGTVLRWVGDRGRAEDLCQEVFVRAYRALRSMEPERRRALSVRPWLWTIALNRCRTHGARRASRPSEVELDPAWVERAGGPGSVAGTAPEAAALDLDWADRLRALGDAQRTGVVLRHVAGLTYAEIAAVTGRPVGTVKADVHRGLAALRAQLEAEDVPEEDW